MTNWLSNTCGTSNTAWDKAADYEKEVRPARPVRQIVMKGAMDLVFFTESEACLVVACEKQETISKVITRYEGDKLVIEQEGGSISIGGGSIRVSGSGNIVSGGTINGRSLNSSFNQGRVIVGLALPEAPAVKLTGSGDVFLYGLKQSALAVTIQGSGDVEATGRVDNLEVDVAGSGDVEADELQAITADLSIAGSGDIEAHVTGAVKARISGSGDIVIHGNPSGRDLRVSGSGDIKFKK